jgi:hypothetical protein
MEVPQRFHYMDARRRAQWIVAEEHVAELNQRLGTICLLAQVVSLGVRPVVH